MFTRAQNIPWLKSNLIAHRGPILTKQYNKQQSTPDLTNRHCTCKYTYMYCISKSNEIITKINTTCTCMVVHCPGFSFSVTILNNLNRTLPICSTKHEHVILRTLKFVHPRGISKSLKLI